MKVLCLHPAVSMRTIRQMKLLRKKGHEVHLRYLGYGTSASLEDDSEIWTTKRSIFKRDYKGSHMIRTLVPSIYRSVVREAIEEEFDVIHTVSMSDVLGAAAVKHSGRVPTVFDVREMVSTYDELRLMKNYIPQGLLKSSIIRNTVGRFIIDKLHTLEKTAIELSTGRLFVSDYTLQLARKKYNFNIDKTLVLYNYIPLDDFPTLRKEKLSNYDGETHIVYSSGLSISDYRGDAPKFLKRLANEEIHVHIHGIFENEETKRVYLKLAENKYIHLERTLPPRKLINELTKYDYGLIYYPKNRQSQMLHTSLPNKFFEYISAGLPVLSSSYKSLKMFIEKYRVGLVFDDVHDLIRKINGLEIKMPNPEKFALDNHIGELEELYRKVQE